MTGAISGPERASGMLLVSSLALLAGFVLGVSFLPAPAKFQARSLSLPVALDVGRATFHLSMNAQWVCAGLIAVMAWSYGLKRVSCSGMLLALACLVIQTAWLIPVLDVRVEQVIAGTPPPESTHHWLYLFTDVAKVAGLAGSAWMNLVRLAAPPGSR